VEAEEMNWLDDYRNFPKQKGFFTASLWAAGAVLAFFVVLIMYEQPSKWGMVFLIVAAWMLVTFAVVNGFGLLYWRTTKMHAGWQRIAWVLYPATFVITFWQATKYHTFKMLQPFFETLATAVIVTLIVGGILVCLSWVVSGFRQDKSQGK
jgi:hypothetical protein